MNKLTPKTLRAIHDKGYFDTKDWPVLEDHADAWEECEAERDALRAKIDLADRALLRAALALSNLGHGDLIGDPQSIALHAASDAAKARRQIEEGHQHE
jgi:hypothetical protein